MCAQTVITGCGSEKKRENIHLAAGGEGTNKTERIQAMECSRLNGRAIYISTSIASKTLLEREKQIAE
jgi:hypothetical protein